MTIKVTDFDAGTADNPQILVWMGYSGETHYFRLRSYSNAIPPVTSFTLTAVIRADNTGIPEGDAQIVFIAASTSFSPIPGGADLSPMTLRIQSFSIREVAGSIWTDETTSTSWTPLTDKTTVWS